VIVEGSADALAADLSVGGLLSVGGIGPGHHRYGPLLANAMTLEVVTGAGRYINVRPLSIGICMTPWIEDQRVLAQADGVSSMEGFCSASMQGPARDWWPPGSLRAVVLPAAGVV
jgi:hypothetical protein